MSGSRIPRRVMALAISAGLCVTAGPLVAPAAVAAPVTAAAAEVPRPALGVAPGSQILSAGTTGFLTAGADDTLRWTRYADGATTDLGKAKEHNTAVNGSVSDTVVTGDDPGSTRASDKITVRNMVTGDSTVLDLAARGYHYSGTVGETVIVHKRVGDSYEVHLLTQTEGTLNDRVVTGLPGSLEDVKTAAGAPGVALLGFTKQFHRGIADYATVNLATAKAVVIERSLSSDFYAEAAISSSHMASLGPVTYAVPDTILRVARRDAPAQGWSDFMDDIAGASVLGLVGDWVLYGNSHEARDGFKPSSLVFRAMPAAGGNPATDSVKVLDHATSAAPAPDGALLVMGGTVERGEGLYRISTGADGKPAAELVAPSGEPTKVTALRTEAPALAAVDHAPWKARWQLSRRNVNVSVTVHHVASGAEYTQDLSPWSPQNSGAGWVDFTWDGMIRSFSDTYAAPNGAYTWRLVAKPMNGVGPDLDLSGSFALTRAQGAHDYSDNGTPDVLVRDDFGSLYREDTVHDAADPKLAARPRQLVGSGWNTYDRLVAVGNVAGAPNADMVARDKDGVLWLYLGTGTGNFTARTRIGGGWNTYNQITAGSDLTGDALGDLVARDAAGTLWLYRGTGNRQAPFSGRVRLGGGWNTYNQITAVGDIAGAKSGDLVARDKDGVLWLYLGTGTGNFTARTRIGGGWNSYRQLIGIGDANNDGRSDVLGYDQQGKPYVYHGTGERQDPLAGREATSLDDTFSWETVA